VADIIGHKENIQQITTWLLEWDAKHASEQKGILVTGPPGVGKTSTVHLIAESLGYHVVEYNASDVRSVSMLQGVMALGMKRLRKEVIIMDEVDGLSGGKERGGVGCLADIIRSSTIPILCIANEMSPKMNPLKNVCLHLKFHRPVKSTIATAIMGIAKKEGIAVVKADLETMCEEGGNDIRSILNTLDFRRSVSNSVDSKKDESLRLDAFSATQRLMASKNLRMVDAEDRRPKDGSPGLFQQAEDLVYVDYSMIPLMVQEAYVSAARDDVEELEKASDLVSHGDLIQTATWKTQDWSLLPLSVANTIAITKAVSGPAPFNIFPQILGKMSKKSKHARYIELLARKERVSAATMRLTYADPLQTIMVTPLLAEKPNIGVAVDELMKRGWDRDDLLEHLPAVLSTPMEIPTKVKGAITREFTKRVTAGSSKKRKVDAMAVVQEGQEEEDEEDGVEEVEERLKMFGI
jgi:replication factor C subunit 1